MSAFERSGWRDQWLSERHRLWGPNLPALNSDGTFFDYDLLEPVSFTEYKHVAAQINRTDPNLAVIVRLAEMTSRPAFLVKYEPDDTTPRFQVRALEEFGSFYVPSPEWMSEEEYIRFQHIIRERTISQLDIKRFQKLLRLRLKKLGRRLDDGAP